VAIDHLSLLILGAGGHGRAVAELARLAGHAVAGFLDARPPGGLVDGLPVWPEADVADSVLPGGGTALALGIGENAARQAAAVRHRGIPQPVLIHPRAIVSPSAVLGAGTVVFPGAIIHTAARIGAAAVINSGAIVEHDCLLGDGVHVAPGAVLCGAVEVGREALVGAGAVVIPGRRVGTRAVVGAGAVVVEDVPEAAVVVGVPARAGGGADE